MELLPTLQEQPSADSDRGFDNDCFPACWNDGTSSRTLVRVSVSGLNDPPVATGTTDSLVFDEDTGPWSITLTYTDAEDGFASNCEF